MQFSFTRYCRYMYRRMLRVYFFVLWFLHVQKLSAVFVKFPTGSSRARKIKLSEISLMNVWVPTQFLRSIIKTVQRGGWLVERYASSSIRSWRDVAMVMNEKPPTYRWGVSIELHYNEEAHLPRCKLLQQKRHRGLAVCIAIGLGNSSDAFASDAM